MQDQPLAATLWRGKWIIATCTILGVVLAGLVTKATPKVYEGQAIINVAAGSASAAATPNDLQLASQGQAQTDASLIATTSFLSTVNPAVSGHRLSVSTLKSRISAKVLTNTSLVQITADGSSPDEARGLASRIATAFVDYEQSASQRRSQDQVAQIQTQLRSVSRKIAAAAAGGHTPGELGALVGARTALQAALANALTEGIVTTGNVHQSGPATASRAPVQPRPLLNSLAGVVLGLIAGIGLAWVRSQLDRGLRDADEVERLLEVPVLATVPLRRRVSHDDHVLEDAFDVLRANLAFLAHDRPMSVLAVTSFNAQEGKTTVVEGIARAAARGGLSVAIVDGDVRKRTLSGRLGHGGTAGLTGAIVGTTAVEGGLVTIQKNLHLLPAGATPPNPPSLLASQRMEKIVQQLRAKFRLVLIDTPPIANLADASILAGISDGVVVVARAGATARNDLRAAVTSLRHSPTPIVGAVFLDRQVVEDYYLPPAWMTPSANGRSARSEQPAGRR